jgi:flagellar hook assembly protein FlgD
MYSNLTQASPLKNSLKKAISAFSLAVIALTVFAANIATVSAEAAAISSFGVAQASFNPDSGSADINFSLSQSGNITLEVFEGSNPIKTLAFRQAVNSGSHSYTWDGRKVDGTKAAAGSYKVQLFFYSDTFALFADDNVAVTYSDNGGGGTTGNVVTNLYDSPDPFDPDTESANIYYTLAQGANITLTIENSSGLTIKTLLNYEYKRAGSTNSTWDGTNSSGNKQSEGRYKYVVAAEGSFGTQTYTGYVNLDYRNTGTAPVISSDYASPSPFDPNHENTNIYFTLNTQSDVTIEIYNGSTKIDTILTDYALSSGQNVRTWDGRNSSNNIVSQGAYTYKIIAQNNVDTDIETGDVSVEYNDDHNGTDPVISSDYASPTPFDPNHENTYVYFTLNTESEVTVEIYNGSTRIDTLISYDTLSAGSHAKVWDGKYSSNNNIVPEGTYTYKITAEKNNYNTDIETGSVTVDYEDDGGSLLIPNITNAYASPITFDPSDNESTTVHFTVNTCVYLTAKVYKESNDAFVKTLKDNEYMCSGTKTVTWNGRDSSGNILNNGDYYIRISVVNNIGSDSDVENVTVDNTNTNNTDAPNITGVDVNPYTFNPDDNEDTTLEYTLDECADITIEVYDDNDDYIDRLKDGVNQCAGDFSVIWDGEDDNNNMADDGVYTFKIWAENSAGDDYATADTEVDTSGGSSSGNGPNITSVTVDPDIFDPTEETTYLQFRLDECADATVKVVDDNNDTVKTFLSNNEICSGTHRYSWNGKDTSNDYVNDGMYEFVITVDNNDGDDSARADVEVDSSGSNSTSPRCSDYEDVSETNPYCDAITYVTNEGIFSGYSDSTFKPYQAINRAETTKVILIGFDYTIMASDGTKLGFKDVIANAWYMSYLRTAKHYGIIKGYPDNTFRPANTVNRVELLKLFLETADVNVPACSYKPYNDTPLNEWYVKYVCYAQTYNLMDADVYNNFNPGAPMTRGDVAELFLRFHEEGLDDNVGTHNDTGSTTTTTGAPDITNVSLSNDAIKQAGSLTISYKLNVKSDVTVEILDDTGDVVRTLVDDVNQTSGTHSATWNTKNDNGSNVAEGTYTVKIRASNIKGSDKYLNDVDVDNSATTTTTGLKVTGLDINRTLWNPLTQGSLEISFTTNKTATVTVAVYDDNNDLVRYLWDNISKTADTYDMLWNGRDRYNNMVADGIYTIRVTAKNSTDTVKDEVDVEVNR